MCTLLIVISTRTLTHLRFILFSCKAEWKRMRKKERKRERSPICWFTSQIIRAAKSGLSQIQDTHFMRVSHVSGRYPGPWAIFCRFPWHIKRELVRKWSNLYEHSGIGCCCFKWRLNLYTTTVTLKTINVLHPPVPILYIRAPELVYLIPFGHLLPCSPHSGPWQAACSLLLRVWRIRINEITHTQ